MLTTDEVAEAMIGEQPPDVLGSNNRTRSHPPEVVF
jgi:hypothetical protein